MNNQSNPSAPGTVRLSRFRQHASLRRLVQEVRLDPSDFILPVFVVENPDHAGPIKSLPGVHRHDLDGLIQAASRAQSDGVGAILLFGIPDRRDPDGSSAQSPHGAVVKGIDAIKRNSPDIPVIADVCLCAFTSDGHCGIHTGPSLDLESTLTRHAEIAVAYAKAGADMVAPSGVFDGLVERVRASLDAEGFFNTPIVSYATKFSSALYGPFREAASSIPGTTDRASHQIDIANKRDGVREAIRDEAEGADALIVKPAGWYLDILASVRSKTTVPVWAYQVSGEYAMIESAAERGWIERPQAVMESLISIKRAGADRVISYYADRISGWLDSDQQDRGSR